MPKIIDLKTSPKLASRYKAKTFLLSVCRQAPKESLEELREMLDDVYAEEAGEQVKVRQD